MSIQSAVYGLSVLRRRPVNLKTSLMLRIAAVALACFCLAAGLVLVEARLDTEKLTAETADVVARHLALQRLRIDSTYEPEEHFPDWDSVVTNIPASGLCLRFTDERGRLVLSNCIGSRLPNDAAPRWFALLHGVVLSSSTSAERAVIYKGRSFGTVRVSTDAGSGAARAWQETEQMLRLTAITVLALCLLVYIVLERALAPAKELVAGLDRIAGGDFTHRLPDYRLFELQRIGEVANQLADKVEATLAERTELSKRLVDTQERERRHLARELHDEFAQNLAAIRALAASVEMKAQRDCPDLQAEASSLTRISMEMMSALRGTLLHLRPLDLEKIGLAESLRQLVAVWGAGCRGRTRFDLKLDERVLPLIGEASIHVYRIAQEALTNAARHAEASHVRLCLTAMPPPHGRTAPAPAVRLTVEDDGKGWRRAKGAASGGMGIGNMRERVAALGGSIAFDDRPGGGLAVRVVVPVGAGREAG